MSRQGYYDDEYQGHSENSQEYDHSPEYEDPEIDSDALNDLSSQELDQRIQQMKAKIKDLQEDEFDFQRSNEKPKPISGKKDYHPPKDHSDMYKSPQDYKQKEQPQKREFDEDSMDNYANDNLDDEKERLKDKIEDIKKAIQQYNSDDQEDKPEESKIGKYYEEDEDDEAYQYSTKPKKTKFSKRSPPRKQWKDTDQEDNDKHGK